MLANRTRSMAVAALLGLLVVTTGAALHHGWSNYDQTKTLNLTGTILESTYANPHGTMRFQTEGKTWTVILAPTARMENRGLTPEMLKAGTKATVVSYPHKKIADETRAERITIGAKTVELR